MLELKQEIVSITVLLIVCITLSVSCLILWMVRCRRDQIRNREDKDNRQRELDNFEDHKRSKARLPSKKVHEGKKDTPKKAETDPEKGKKDEKKKRAAGTVARTDETMHQFETRMKMESTQEDGAQARNKRLDTVSITVDGATDAFQRNDSKNNVFSVDRVDEMDLNPGLSGSINLETI